MGDQANAAAKPSSVTEALKSLDSAIHELKGVRELSTVLRDKFNRTESNPIPSPPESDKLEKTPNIVDMINQATERVTSLQYEIGVNIEYVVRKL